MILEDPITVLVPLLPLGPTILFSEDLSGDYFEQVRAERLIAKFSWGRPMQVLGVISGRRNKTLDTSAYSYATRLLVGLDMERRESNLMCKDGPKNGPDCCKISLARTVN